MGLPVPIVRQLLQLRTQMLVGLGRDAENTTFCQRCLLPFPEGDFEEYAFCPWCRFAQTSADARDAQATRVIEAEYPTYQEIQCGECGDEYEQPLRYRFRFCPYCGALFSEVDELVIELPFVV